MHVSGPYQAVGWRFSVRCDDEAVGQLAAAALVDLRASGDDAGATYVLRMPTAVTDGTLRVDGEVLATGTPWLLYATLFWHVNRGTVLHSSDHVLLHASAAELDGRAVLMCAPMESGKTTLVAGLVLDGLRYLTDEAVAIRPADLGITGYPKALSVDEGSWDVLPGLRPDVPAELEHLLHEQWQVPVSKIRADAVVATARPAVLVLPRYEQGAATELTPVPRAQALAEVLGQVFEPDRDRPRDLSVLAEVLRGCACYRLVNGDLGEAVRLVRGALEEAG